MSLFPEKIKGKMVAILTAHTDQPPAKISIAEFDSDEEIWSEEYWKVWHNDIDSHALPDLKRKSTDHIEVGAPPIKTDRGWLLLYSHIQNYGTSNQVFGIEALLLDINDPRRIIGRTAGPILTPEEIYEEHGHVPKIVFPTGALIQGDKLVIFYGAADTTCAAAEVRLDDLLNSMTPEARGRHVRRYVGNPILKPNQRNDWESFAVFNPAAIDLGGKIHVLYRAMGKDATSTVGYFTSKDGYSIDEKLDTPIYMPRESFEMKMKPGNSGCEDPRIVQIDDSLYMCYTAYDGIHAPGVAITSISAKDFLAHKWNWAKPVLITPQDIDDKDSCLFPAKVGDKYMILHRIESHICADFIPTLDFKTEKVTKCIQMLGPRAGMWDDVKVGIAAPPIKTDKGWLLFYHGVSSDHAYRVGAALFDLQNPTIVISRTTDYIFEPEADYEKNGIVPNVVFPCGVVLRDDLVFIYYGGADTVIGVATIKMSELLRAMA
jgi:predicted GH43/DUF377 family glycosyl hydrolase